MARRGDRRIGAVLYFLLIAILLVFLVLHAFSLIPLNTGTFTRFLISLLVVVMLLPSVFRVKIFDLIEVTRKTRMFKKK